jgi:predicted unusual protein kinase regulating ubiquinone biosynthesis (AarF/ABC1/UbiB family)
MIGRACQPAGQHLPASGDCEGFFHADMHQGNLFVQADGTIAAIDFGIMGRINRQARLWLAEILYGLTTGNYRRVAEIHFEAQYVPALSSMSRSSRPPCARWASRCAASR